jgi:hypothetical protein
MIRRRRITRTKKIVRTKKPVKKISRIKNRNVKCWGVHLMYYERRFWAPPNHYIDKPYYLAYDVAVRLKIELEKKYTAKFKIKNYETN